MIRGRYVKIPSRPPREPWGRRFTNRVARAVPFGNDRVYLSLWLEEEDRPGGVTRVVPWLFFYNDETGFALRLVRLPGAKIVERWDPEHEEWLERFICPEPAEDET